MAEIKIDAERLLADLTTLRSFGASGNGVVRQAFSEVDLAARRWLAGRMAEAGLRPQFDPIGNLFGLPPGEGPAILLGSHSDTQAEGGWLDGAFGVIAGLEVARASVESGGPPVAAVAFQDEEGRFLGLTGSRVWMGEASLEEADDSLDRTGVRLGDLRREVPELMEAKFISPKSFSAFLEAHIEQGPVLDSSGESVGVVEAIVGSINLPITFLGQQNHAGTTPMALRRDAFRGLWRFAERFDAAFQTLRGPATVWTIGHLALHPNAPSIVPGRAHAIVQWRDIDAERLHRLEEAAREAAAAAAQDIGLELKFGRRDWLPPVPMELAFVAELEKAAEALAAGRWRRMPSGALHDATVVSSRLPTAMIFAPSIGGVSHSFVEDTRPEDLALCVQVLAKAVSHLKV